MLSARFRKVRRCRDNKTSARLYAVTQLRSCIKSLPASLQSDKLRKDYKAFKMKKLLLVVAAGLAFGYFGACVVNHAWKYYYGEQQDNDDGYDTDDAVSRKVSLTQKC